MQKADLEKVIKTLSKARHGKGIRNLLGRKFSKAEIDDKPVQMEGNAAYNAVSAEETISTEKNAAYSITPQFSDAPGVYEVVNDAEMGAVGDDFNTRPFNWKTRRRTKRVKGLKSSVSSESLTIYEDMELDLTNMSQDVHMTAKVSTLPVNNKGRPLSMNTLLSLFGKAAKYEKRERSNTEVPPKLKK